MAYSASGGDLDQWLTILLRISLMFIIFRRRNYDKATLCQLSDIIYYLLLPFQSYYFPVLDATIDQPCLPLGYAFPGHEPNVSLACDKLHCAGSVNFDNTVRLTCGHTFHKKVRAASSQTNKHLAEDDDEDERSDSDDGGDDQDDDEDQEDQPNHGDDDNDDFDEDSYHRQVKELQKKAISHFTELKQQSPISD